MGSQKSELAGARHGSARTVRASVTLNSEVYRILEALAKQKEVSTTWVLRDAAEKYVADQWPLFQKPRHDN